MSHPGLAHGYPCFPCLLIAAPFYRAMRRQRHPLHSPDDGPTMKEDAPLLGISGFSRGLKQFI